MDLDEYRKKEKLSFSGLASKLGWSKAKTYRHCADLRPCIRLIDANVVVRATEGEVGLADLVQGDC